MVKNCSIFNSYKTKTSLPQNAIKKKPFIHVLLICISPKNLISQQLCVGMTLRPKLIDRNFDLSQASGQGFEVITVSYATDAVISVTQGRDNELD